MKGGNERGEREEKIGWKDGQGDYRTERKRRRYGEREKEMLGRRYRGVKDERRRNGGREGGRKR